MSRLRSTLSQTVHHLPPFSPRQPLSRSPQSPHQTLTPPRTCQSHLLPLSRPYSSSPSPFPTTRRRSPFLRPLNLLVILVPIVTFSLGVWQIRRLRWKVALIEEIERAISREPMVLPANISLAALPDFAFRRVLLQGHYELPPILLGPRVKDGVPGYELIQPFHRSAEGSSTILVDRGFVTTTRATAIREGREPPPPAGDGDVVVEGMLSKKFDKGKGRWQPDNEPENNQWFWKDVEGMAEWCGTGRVQPVLVDAVDYHEHPSTLLMQQGIPVGKPPTVEIRNQHATYAATWFTLSAATAGMLVMLLRRGGGGPRVPKTWTGRL